MSTAANAQAPVAPVIAAQPVAISADGSTLLAHEADARLESTGSVRFDPRASGAGDNDPVAARAAFRAFFDIVATARFIHRQRCTRVGLQFPDEQLPQATNVVRELQEEVARLRATEADEAASAAAVADATASLAAASITAATAASTVPVSNASDLQLYILADTSYGACCVDEVAAQHAACDLIVHFGFTCLSRTRRMPVRYVFGRKAMNVDTMIGRVFDDAQWQSLQHESNNDSSSSFSFSFSSPEPTAATSVDPATLPPVCLLFMYNLEYAYAIEEDGGDMPTKLDAFLRAKSTGRKYVVSLARVQQEQSRADIDAVFVAPSTSPSTTPSTTPSTSQGCAQGACACACKTGTASAAASSSCSCATTAAAAASSCCAVTPAAAPSFVSDAAAPITTDKPAFIFASPGVNADLAPSALTSYHLAGYSFAFPSSIITSKADFQSNVQIVWIGPELDSRLLVNAMLNFNSNTFHLYNPLTGSLRREIASKSKVLSRRYYLMEKVKNAEIVGILVGTLGVERYLDMITHLKRLLRNAGKKSYLFVVGKPNEPKLSNFGEVDLFVMVACPLNAMFDSTGYYRDVVTPFEVEMALKGREWNGEYRTDFRDVLASADAPVSAATVAASSDAAEPSSSLDDLAHGMRYDPITGKMRAALPSQLHAAGIRLSSDDGDVDNADGDDDEGEEGQLVMRDSQQLVRVEGGALVQLKTASDHFLASRSFTGLLLKHPGEADDSVATIEPGLSGIARNYTQTQLPPAPVQQQTQLQGQMPSEPQASACAIAIAR